MITRRQLIACSTLLMLGLGQLTGISHAQTTFPSKPIQFVVPYPPGGPLDSAARLIAEHASPLLGQPIVVENKPGAGGNLGADAVAKSAPDGYTLVMGAIATHAVNPHLFQTIPYDAIQDFQPITIVAAVPNVLIVNKEFATKNHIASVQDLITFAKSHPGKLNFSSGGNGSTGHLAGELFNKLAQVDTTHIPFAGAAPAQLSLLSGEVDFMFDNLASALNQIKADKVIVLGVTTQERSFALPNTPTIAEQGLKDFNLGTWYGVFAPANIPADTLNKLHTAIAQALNSPALRESLKNSGSDVKPNDPAEFATFVKAEYEKYKRIIKDSGITL